MNIYFKLALLNIYNFLNYKKKKTKLIMQTAKMKFYKIELYKYIYGVYTFTYSYFWFQGFIAGEFCNE